MNLQEMRLMIRDCDDFLNAIGGYLDTLEDGDYAKAHDWLEHHRETLEIHLENMYQEVLEYERD